MNQKQNIKVPLLDIPLSYKEVLADVEKNINEVIESGYFILGPVVEELEQKIVTYCEAKYAVGVSSGTDALLISLMAAGIKEDDEVITTPFTFFATTVLSRRPKVPVETHIDVIPRIGVPVTSRKSSKTTLIGCF